MSENEKLLMDFSSPVINESHKPLIPMPRMTGNPVLSPVNDNPFDIVATQSESSVQNDPFELVFQTAFKEKFVIKVDKPQDDVKSVPAEIRGITNGKGSPARLLKSSCVASNGDESLIKEQSLSPLSIVGSEGDVSKVSIGDCSSINLDDSNNTDCNPNLVENKEDESQNLADFSSEEGLKAVIATRVNKCIEKVLNNTGVKTTDDIIESETVSYFSPGPKHHRRSLSTSVVKKEFIHKLSSNNRSFAGGIFVLQNDERLVQKPFKSTSSSSCSSNGLNRGFVASKFSSDLSSVSNSLLLEKSGDNSSVFLPNNDDIFKEAKKLANTFSEIATNLTHNKGNKDEDNDLMACKPDCLYNDSSEDEAEMLRRDPSLNFHSTLSKQGLSKSFTADETTDSEALSRFKHRSQDSSEAEKPKLSQKPPLLRSNSWNARPPQKFQKPRLPITVPVAIVNPEESGGLKPLKLKKAVVEPTRRGPLKAIVPIQNMTKPQNQKIIEENAQNRNIYPKPTQQCKLNVVTTPSTPVRKKKGIQPPIAASTPNRQAFLSTSVKVNQRKSLDSQIRSLENSTMKRPKSANSSFNSRAVKTTPVLQVTQSRNKIQERNKCVSVDGGKTSEKLLSKLKRSIGRNVIAKDKENNPPV